MTHVAAKDWKFPLACPNCLKREGVPRAIATQTEETLEVWVRCCRCAHEWRIEADMPQLILKAKKDRRGL